MSKQTNTIVVSSLAIGALAWVDPLFIPLVTLGPLLSGLVAGAYGVRPRIVAIPWFCAGLLMLVSDQLIYQEDVAFHAGIAVFTALVAAGTAALARRLRRSDSRRHVGRTKAEAEIRHEPTRQDGDRVMSPHAKTLSVLALLAVTAFAGCGGGSSAKTSSGSTRPDLSRSEFVAKANAICEQANRQLERAARKTYRDGEPTAAQVQEFLAKDLIPAIEQEVARIRALPAPAGDENRVKALLDATAQGVQEAKANPNLLQAHGRRDPLFRAIKLARQYGLTVCARQ